MKTPEEELKGLLERLPDGSKSEDIQYQLYVLAKVRKGLDAATSEGTFTQEHAENILGRWLIP